MVWLSRKDNGRHFTPKPKKHVAGVKSSIELEGVTKHKFLKKNDSKTINAKAKEIWDNYSDKQKKNHYATYEGIKPEHVDLTGLTFSMLPKYVKMALIDEIKNHENIVMKPCRGSGTNTIWSWKTAGVCDKCRGGNKMGWQESDNQLFKRHESVIVRQNPHGRTIFDDKELERFDIILHDSELKTDASAVIGKVPRNVIVRGYSKTDNITKADNIDQYKVYQINNMYVGEYNLKEVAIDAKLNGLLKNSKINTLLEQAKFETSEQSDRPVLIKLDNMTYLIAPIVRNY